MTTLEWDEVFDCAVAAWCRSSTSQEMLRMCFQSRARRNEVSVGWTANELMAFATGIARLVASPTPPAEQQATPKAAPGVGNSGFDHQSAADFLSGKTVSDEAVRKFVAASRWAHDERAALSATLLAMHGVLTSREAEIALLKKALLEAEAAPQQEAQEPVAWLNPWRADQVTTDYDAYGERGIPLYTAPQPAPAPTTRVRNRSREARIRLRVVQSVGV